MRAENKLGGKAAKLLYPTCLLHDTANALPKLGLATVQHTSLANNVNRHTHPPKFTDRADMLSCNNPTPTRISNAGFSPRYMDYADSLALGELGDPL